jgi:hypothetical protein
MIKSLALQPSPTSEAVYHRGRGRELRETRRA